MEQLLDRPLAEVLEGVGAATPAPGGGSSAAVACALAAGLVQMVAGITLARDDTDAGIRELRDRAARLRDEAAALAELELRAYAPVLAAMRRPADDPERPAALDAALSEAAESPLAIARVAAAVAELAVEAARRGRPHLRGDALTGVLLAEAAVAAASRLAVINLDGRPGDPRFAELERLMSDAARARMCACDMSGTPSVTGEPIVRDGGPI
jgi:formiminotetrahydrofolate cyclodeaminase